MRSTSIFIPAHERLFNALLFEMASGHHKINRRFLSNRVIRRSWRVSATTARKALELLCSYNLVRVSDRSGHYLSPDYRERALTLLAKSANDPLATPFVSGQDLRQRLIAGKSPAASSSMKIGVLLLTPYFLPKNRSRDPGSLNLDVAAASTARGIYLQAAESRHAIDFVASNGMTDDLARIFQRLSRTAPDGVVIICRIPGFSISKSAESLLKQLIPVVSIFNECEETDIISVDFNNVGMGVKAAEILINARHERLGILCPVEPSHYNIYDRSLGFEQEVGRSNERGTSFSNLRFERFFTKGMPTLAETAKVTQEMEESGITALFSIGHELLEALLPSLHAKGLHAPERLSLLSCSAHSKVGAPPWNVDILRMDFEAMGRIACRALADYRRGEVAQKCYRITPSYHSSNSIRVNMV